ncbi:MAG: PUR family DNA/RNA-binding protein [Bacteroidaceae bacterium]|jgi:hypothetical protein|nr:PUR family DNA/RNA-binding protein [Bacteroidaceae bacterium]
MEEQKKGEFDSERDILFSKTIKAGQRIYYVDVKRNRKDELYLSITESKKMLSGNADMPQVSYEKHKIFLYAEDFQKFLTSLTEAMDYINKEQGEAEPREEANNEIKIDMDF